jgi:hypothetical protein
MAMPLLTVLPEPTPDGNSTFAIFTERPYGGFTICNPEPSGMPARNLDGLIRGDAPLARKIFSDERKRRLIRRLQEEGWPIFDVAGKRCADPGELERYRRDLIKRARKAARKLRAIA